MWDLIVSVPDHCLSFYFETNHFTTLLHTFSCTEPVQFVYLGSKDERCRIYSHVFNEQRLYNKIKITIYLFLFYKVSYIFTLSWFNISLISP